VSRIIVPALLVAFLAASFFYLSREITATRVKYQLEQIEARAALQSVEEFSKRVNKLQGEPK
jgi:lipopolysaccharide export LptBFGC system permease protein LptF